MYLTRIPARRRLANRAAAAAVLFYVSLALAGRFHSVLRGGQRAGGGGRGWEAARSETVFISGWTCRVAAS